VGLECLTQGTQVFSPKSKTSARDPLLFVRRQGQVLIITAAGDNDQSAVRLAVPSSHLAWPHRASTGQRGLNMI